MWLDVTQLTPVSPNGVKGQAPRILARGLPPGPPMYQPGCCPNGDIPDRASGAELLGSFIAILVCEPPISLMGAQYWMWIRHAMGRGLQFCWLESRSCHPEL